MANAFASSVGATSGGEASVTTSAIVAQAVGSHILRIDGYSQIKGLGNGKYITSEEFAVGGHRWRLDFYPAGFGSCCSDWISVFLRLDRTNVEEVKAKMTASLLDQEGNPVPSYSRDDSAMRSFSAKQGAGSAWGFREFIKRSDLEGSFYIKDDVFSVRFHITVAKEVFTKAIPVSEVVRPRV